VREGARACASSTAHSLCRDTSVSLAAAAAGSMHILYDRGPMPGACFPLGVIIQRLHVCGLLTAKGCFHVGRCLMLQQSACVALGTVNSLLQGLTVQLGGLHVPALCTGDGVLAGAMALSGSSGPCLML